jgi:hypothetical protein
MAQAVHQRIPIGGTGLTITITLGGKLAEALGGAQLSRAAWARIMRAMDSYNRVMGAELAAKVVAESRKGRLRKSVSSGRMDAATLDPRNFQQTRTGWGIGVPSFLDNSQAKYWRQIEEGTSVHVGRKIKGVWGQPLGPWRGEWYGIAGPGDWSRPGGGKQMFEPFSTWDKRRSQRMQAKPGSFWAEIRRPILAQDAYVRAFADFKRSRRALTIFREVVAQELGLARRNVGRSYAAAVGQLLGE